MFQAKVVLRWLHEHNIGFSKVSVYETNKGFHFYLDLEYSLHEWEILLIQALLGSDFKRETLNYFRVRNDERHWNVLFKEKRQFLTNKLLSWERESIKSKKIEKTLTEYLVFLKKEVEILHEQ